MLTSSSYLRLIDSCITQLKAQGPARTCNESKAEEEVTDAALSVALLHRKAGVRGKGGGRGGAASLRRVAVAIEVPKNIVLPLAQGSGFMIHGLWFMGQVS